MFLRFVTAGHFIWLLTNLFPSFLDARRENLFDSRELDAGRADRLEVHMVQLGAEGKAASAAAHRYDCRWTVVRYTRAGMSLACALTMVLCRLRLLDRRHWPDSQEAAHREVSRP